MVEVEGESFCLEDLYEMVGKNGFMSTFEFKPDTQAFNKFGKSITGVIYYTKEELEQFENSSNKGIKNEAEMIKIDSPTPEISQAQREDLKYGGVLVADIESLSFLPYSREPEFYESGEKKVPNVINIPFKSPPGIDYDVIYLNYIISKIQHKTELIPHEKEKFIGIALGVNDGHISSKLLENLGYDLETIKSNYNIWYHLYKTKEHRKLITEEERSKLADLEFILWSEKIRKLLTEIKKSGINSKDLATNISVLKTIMSSLSKFEPSVLFYSKKQIYWNVDSYLHIVLRHVKQLQVGNFKNKTPFPYRFNDLEMLIQQVLGVVRREVRNHFEKTPEKDFVRRGKMSVPFNANFYSFGIDKQGRLMTLYVSG